MNSNARSYRAPTFAWLAGLLVCVAVLVLQLRFSYDLGLFLPPPKTADQRVLVERLGDAPGSRLVLAGLPGASDDDVDSAVLALEQSGQFTRVLAGPPAPELADIPDVVWRNRFLLDPAPLDAAALRQAIADRTADLALFAGSDFNRLLQADPTMAALSTLERLSIDTGDTERWKTAQGTPVLLIETQAAAFDLGKQAEAVQNIQQTLEAAGLRPSLSGPGVFGVELKNTIHAEARNRSMLASVGLALVLLVAYRRLPVLVLAALPLLSGAIAGLAAVALAFPAVHGITLAFGFTLLGIAIDYPLHLFSHARSAPADKAIKSIWPTLRLGAASTLIAYLAIALSGSQGTAQLGVFTAVGLLVAALVTRGVLPGLIKPPTGVLPTSAAPDVRLRWLPVIFLALAGAGLFAAMPGELWNNRLSDLSPVPPERLQQDQLFREAVGTPSLRHVIAIRGPDLQAVLESTEALDAALADARNDGLLQNWQAVTRLLPSRATFAKAQERLPNGNELPQYLTAALRDSPFAPGIFTEFLDDAIASTTAPPLAIEDFAGTALEPFIKSHLYFSGSEWISLFSLYDVAQPAELNEWLSQQEGAPVLVDFRDASESLVADYRRTTLRMLGFALVLILAVLLWRLPPARALWCLGVVGGVVLATGSVLIALGGPLNLYHLMALLLVAGLGLDYALFLSRQGDSVAARADTHHAVLACGASTAVAFGMLATSSIPALHALGMTVTIGTILSLATAWLGARELELGSDHRIC